ncbi:MAG: histidine phosphatase family protein, partial [Thiohalocapsa sp.]|nr:histidine phosphatase family protein [Thiohalocapsa sp.]
MNGRFVDLVRHGAVEGGPAFNGSLDVATTAAGRAALMHALESAAPAWDRILCSPARRCAEPAAALGTRLGLPVETLAGLRERHFGQWEGLRADQVDARALARFWADPCAYDPPGAESFADFQARVRAAWSALTAGDATHALVLTHGGVIRVMLAEVLGMAPRRLLALEV